MEKLESYLTPQGSFGDVSRGNPVPHSLSEARRKEVGLTRETWQLEVISDSANPATLDNPLSRKNGNALTFSALLEMGKTRAIRFAKVMTCLNLGCPLGMGIWEGVPLRDVLWLTKPRENLRRVFYYGYHNDDPKQLFQSSLPASRVLEDLYGLPPVILCYKLNGDWLTPERGGPVRMVVPEGYGFKSIKWLSHIVPSNIPHANDTYASGNNDIDSPLKTFAATLSVPKKAKANHPLPITGYAQVGVAGLARVQVWMTPAGKGWPEDDPYFTRAPWTDAHILPLQPHVVPAGTLGFDVRGKPMVWPMRLTKAHWAVLLPGLPAGEYLLRCRTIDERGEAQPMPRPFKKSGRCDLETVKVSIVE